MLCKQAWKNLWELQPQAFGPALLIEASRYLGWGWNDGALEDKAKGKQA